MNKEIKVDLDSPIVIVGDMNLGSLGLVTMIQSGAAISDRTKLLLRYQLDIIGRQLIKMLLTGYVFYMCTIPV